MITAVGSDRIDPREAGRLSTAIAQQIRRAAATNGRTQVHLVFHGPYPMAVLVGRHLNTLHTVVYEWVDDNPGGSRYVPALVLEPGLAGGPITEVLIWECSPLVPTVVR
ncbi:SAVED domain-containing protein [Herbiconiux ginsengi]|uniref:SAVED domain-containing protein n=1 Tax=Herbiconiux ginsengi TaxID=381665 RepID=UPI001C3170D5